MRLSARWAVGSILGIGFIPKHADRKIILLGQDGGPVADLDVFGFSDATVQRITALLKLWSATKLAAPQPRHDLSHPA